MSDSTSAEIFGMLFEELAKGTKPKDLAKKMWAEMGQYDFDPYDMDCQDALIALGLCEETDDEDDPYRYANSKGKL